ncbi:MAG TPA: serine hydrolase [Patescibacteria group bacterium]|nr:serine hydrolase [Patescibacteria group bacterium]
MKKTIILLALALLAALPARAADTKEEMIRRVENGLARDVQIGPAAPMTLAGRMKDRQVPGVAVAVVKDFELQWAKGYGVSAAGKDDPVTADTLFQVASITKCMGAVVAMRLVQDGLLDPDKNVNDYLKRWKVPDNEFTMVEKVTLRRILSHRAGLTVSGFRGYAAGEAVPTILQVLDGLPPANSAPIRVDKVPGGTFRYSGGGYTVLQLLLEDVSGRPLAKLAEEYIFKPAGMTRSGFCTGCPPVNTAQVSMGHSVDRDGKLTVFPGYAFLPQGSGCCELWTSASDLARFVIAFQRALRGDAGAILKKETARAMVAVEAGNPAGLGFFIQKYGSVSYFNHDGGNIGFSARFIGHPELGYGAAILINSDSPGSLLSELTMAVAGAYGWEGIKPLFFKDTGAMVDTVRRGRQEAPDDPENSEGSLNQRGYYLLASGYPDAALAVFQLNLEFNPQSANCSDSLAEAYERRGDRVNALKYYRQALTLLERFPERNKGYERARAAAAEKVRKLEGEKRP